MGDVAANRFLVVEDDRLLGRALARMMRPYGEAAVAGTVCGARRLLAAPVAWTGFVVDIALPDGSGFEVLGDARTAFPHAPAVVLTGRVDRDAANAAYDLGATYMVKPVALDRLRRFLQEATLLDSGPGGARRRPLPRPPLPPPPASEERVSPWGEAARLPDLLEKRIAELRELLARRPDARTRYAIGATVAEIKSRPGQYGAGAVAVVAVALGEDVPSLYRHATVAERWSAKEVEELLDRRGRDGKGLSWSHLVALGTVSGAAARAGLVERTLAEGLSVRELSALAVERTPGARGAQ